MVSSWTLQAAWMSMMSLVLANDCTGCIMNHASSCKILQGKIQCGPKESADRQILRGGNGREGELGTDMDGL